MAILQSIFYQIICIQSRFSAIHSTYKYVPKHSRWICSASPLCQYYNKSYTLPINKRKYARRTYLALATWKSQLTLIRYQDSLIRKASIPAEKQVQLSCYILYFLSPIKDDIIPQYCCIASRHILQNPNTPTMLKG